ncbi:hypothetical protein NA2_09026 [Nitratireductor pacificus pht-3B]|uniref:Cell wall hydrolase SleB domain-containing protein n=1 Tax=Nitratireductor pacificus pht-3B TaxID=391937 RepID=K2MAS4_9HYPH|nr:cell wall hydrolase [Nitratireductor pacificus]EKF19261.1 hypothetical protein NA2_09026 [Nitratireductor pacificus pht-3B]
MFQVFLLGGLFVASLSGSPQIPMEVSMRGLAPRPEQKAVPVARHHEKLCLALAVYHEARGEPEAGQLAVTMVVRNRVLSPRYPPTICGVVFQNARWKNRCQFSFACAGASLLPLEGEAWSRALRIASASAVPSRCSGMPEAVATHYHADRVRPAWARSMDRLGRIGQHVFFVEGAVNRRTDCAF